MIENPSPHETCYYQDGLIHIDGILPGEIVEQIGTPVYVYSLRRIQTQLARLRTAFAPLAPRLHYSLKANANGHLLRALIAAGCGCDAVSAGEIFLAKKAGCPPERIVFAGVGKTAAEMRYALEQNIGWFNVENAYELAQLDHIAHDAGKRPKVALRINPALQADTHHYIATGHAGAKFGIPLDEARGLLSDQASYPRLNIAGLHIHIGSQLGRPDESAAAAQIALNLAHEFGLRHLNLGGGFPVAYDENASVPSIKAFAEALVPILAGKGIDIAFEPGRFLVAEAGVLLATIQYVKNEGRTIVLDAGMTDLLRPALYHARHPIWPAKQHDSPRHTAQVVGPICESADVLHPAAELPLLQPGDLVAIGVAGAYCMSMAPNYNGRPRPAEVLIEDGSWRLIRRRETFEDLIRQEVD